MGHDQEVRIWRQINEEDMQLPHKQYVLKMLCTMYFKYIEAVTEATTVEGISSVSEKESTEDQRNGCSKKLSASSESSCSESSSQGNTSGGSASMSSPTPSDLTFMESSLQ